MATQSESQNYVNCIVQNVVASAFDIIKNHTTIAKVRRRKSRICFDEEPHIYYVDGRPINTSVTTVIHRYFEHFDAESVCLTMIKSRAFMTRAEHAKYKNIPIWRDSDTDADLPEWTPHAVLRSHDLVVPTILQSWEDNRQEAATLGTEMHADIEAFIKTRALPDRRSTEFNYFMDYYKHMTDEGYLPYAAELRVFDTDLSLAGSIDMMWIHRRNVGHSPTHITLVDWKRTKDLKFKAFKYKKGCGPCAGVQDCNYYHYTLQLNVYKHLLESHYDIYVDDMHLVVLYPENESYIKVPINDMQYIVKDIINDLRRRCVSLKT
jgi:hypothetical protein